MKIENSPYTARKRGFTLIEMIGVLAIIAILAVVIAPKVFGAIRTSRINSTLVSIDTFKTAAVDFVGRHGALPDMGHNSQRLDDLLIKAGVIDERFASKIGAQTNTYATAGASWAPNNNGVWAATNGDSQNAFSRIMSRTSNTAVPSSAAGRNFYLDGTNSLPTGSRVVYAVLVGVPIAEARELSERVDGNRLSTLEGADGLGKVVYAAPNAAGLTTVYVYMLHQ